MEPPQQRYDMGHTLRKMVRGQEGVRGKTSGFTARKKKSRHHVCCSGSACLKTEKKQAHVAQTHLRNSDPLPDGAIETEGRGSLDLRGDSKQFVDWVNGDSKDTGDRKDVTTEYPRTSTFFVAE